MRQQPVISVCIANYNGMDVIDECLASVLGQDGDLSVEIVVHDDASSDGSATYIRDSYPRVRLIESKKNVGFCVANNRMVEVSRGEYLLLLNNDAALLSDALMTLYTAAELQERPAILGLPQYDAESGDLLDIGSLLDPFLNPVPNRDPHRGEVGMVMGACLWVPKRMWMDLGGFPEWFGSVGEDLYLCCRARLAGYPVCALGASGFRHHVGISFGGGTVRQGKLATTFTRRALSERNKTFVMVMTYPAPTLQLMLPLHLLLLLVEGIVLTIVKGRLAPLTEIYLPVLLALVRNRQRLRAARKTIAARRAMGAANFFAGFSFFPHKLRMLLRHGLPQLK